MIILTLIVVFLFSCLFGRQFNIFSGRRHGRRSLFRNTMAAKRHPYSSLKPRRSEIRILTLQPGTGAKKISCTLEIVSSTSNIQYEALSYVWGDACITSEIQLDGVPFQVTTNLRAALAHLRLATRARSLWVDALCINQEDTEERESQVRLMRDIYQRATRVVAWLGVSSIESKAVFRFFDSLDSSDLSEITRGGKESSTSEHTQLLRRLDVLRRRLWTDGTARQALMFFFTDVASRPWWSRVWIVQEAALAREIILTCGAIRPRDRRPLPSIRKCHAA